MSQEVAATLEHSGKINTDEDIAYTLLFNDSVMVAPASYYGVDKHKGFLRITCSAEDDKVEQLMDRLEEHLKQSRLRKQQYLNKDITRQRALLEKLNASAVAQLPKFASILTTNTATAFELKEENKRIENYLLMINRETPEGKQRVAIRIQSAFRGHRARAKTKEMIKSQHSEWLNFVERVSPQTDTGVGAYLKQLTVA